MAGGAIVTEPKKRSNLRLGLIMASIAAVFFFGVIADHIFQRYIKGEPPADQRESVGGHPQQ